MTTKKTTTAKTATAKKPAAAKKATAPKKAASKATAIAEPALVAPTVKEKLTTTVMMPDAPVTEIAMEAVVAQAEANAPVAAAPVAPAAAPVAQKIVLTIGMLQKRLSELGAYDGAWDGVYGPMTKHAVARFQAKSGLAVNGDATPTTLAALGLDLYKTY